MSDPTLTPSGSDQPSPAGGDPSASRRRLLQGGLAAAPVLMTLVSRPVLGQVQTPSAFCSGNASVQLRNAALSAGRSPGFWKQEQSFASWVPPFYPVTVPGTAASRQATLFDSIFTPHYPGKTLLDVLRSQGGPPDEAARYAVATLLNIAAGWTPVLTIKTVKGIWGEYITRGYFEPNAGIHWDHGQIVSYLQSTMPV
jgi:hypothetical protein